MFYPWISEFLYQIQSGSKVSSYEEITMNYTQEQMRQMLVQAEKYNEQLLQKQLCIADPFAENLDNSKDMV